MAPTDPEDTEQRAVRQASKIAIPVMTIGFVLMVTEVVTLWVINGSEVSSLICGVAWSAILSGICLGIWLSCAAAVGRSRKNGS